nr:transposase family protein [Verminephrobacter aporrectodeae]
MACPACGAAGQPIHDRLHRSWRHLEALLHKSWVAWHAYAQRAACANCDTDRVHSRFFARRFAQRHQPTIRAQGDLPRQELGYCRADCQRRCYNVD